MRALPTIRYPFGGGRRIIEALEAMRDEMQILAGRRASPAIEAIPSGQRSQRVAVTYRTSGQRR